ncbi:MAG: mannose-1-phosphate guanylyltransferase [Hyphomicrobium sp.]|nr:MAG: mannose-1-phosphate guanylyltransferase [Hyphomicrobium sp.]PPD01296.1 MAG: mannose-1-phosphate guanylyltransferase [Hyphomicrobium sp.]
MPPAQKIDTAFVLAAGMGSRMRPLTDTRPKPLVTLAGRALIDHVLDRLNDAGFSRAIVNVHYLADQIEAHVAQRAKPHIIISDERDVLLDTGGGVKHALSQLGDTPFLIHNSDSVWIEHSHPVLETIQSAWNPHVMDSLMLIAPSVTSLGYDGRGDFMLDELGRLSRPQKGTHAPYVFAGVSIANTQIFDNAPDGRFSLNALWDNSISQGRLYGVILDGLWMHVGTPEALADAEQAIAANASAKSGERA